MGDLLLTKDIYNNPTELAAVILDNAEQKLLNGEGILADSNSPFIFLIESACTLTAGAIELINNQFPALYPKRAQTMEDLYKHLSDYEHIELFATPAETSMSLIFNKRELIEKAKVLTDSDYYLLQLPKDTYIYFGPYVFGIYFPINILITQDTHLVYVNYDTTESNPLKTISDNNLEFREYNYQLADLIEINLPITQFQTTTTILDCSKIAGLNTKVNYTDRLYSIRVFHKKNDIWNELNVVYSETMYDPDIASIIAKHYSDTKNIHLIIPQIYFDNDQIGSKLKVEVYTTLGTIDIDISNINPSAIKISIPNQSENLMRDYCEVFNKLETLHVVPHKPIIAGGTNEANFKTIKKRILNRISINGLLVSPGQLKYHYEDLGFDIQHIKDSLEERIYAACGLLTDYDEVPMQVGMFTTEVPLDIPEHVLKHAVVTDEAITILPTAIFRYDTEMERAFFISKEEEESINKFYKSDKTIFCLYLNENNFTRNIYHIHVQKRNRTPYLVNYDLGRPSVPALRFVHENIKTAEQISIVNYEIIHNCYEERSVTNIHKYTLSLYVTCSEGIKELLDLDPDKIRALVIFKIPNNLDLYQYAELVGKDPDNEKQYIFNVYFHPTYEFNEEGEIGINVLTQVLNNTYGYFTSEFTSKAFINLNSTIRVLFIAKYPAILNQTLFNTGDIFDLEFKQLTLQEVDITLGYNLHNKLYSSVDLMYCRKADAIDGDDNYIVPKDEYAKYPEDIYARNDDGTLVINLTNELIDTGIVKKPFLYVVDKSTVGKISCSSFEIVIGNVTPILERPRLEIISENITGEIKSSTLGNDYDGFSQVQAPWLKVIDDSVTGRVYSSPFAIIHGCVGKVRKPHIYIVSKHIEGTLRTSEFECDVVCEIPKVNLNKIHKQGDLILDETGKPVIINPKGSIRLDLGGNPKIHPREIIFMGNILHVSLNLYYADTINQANILKNLAKRAETQYEKMLGSADRLLENTYVLYRPYTSIGKGTFYANSSKVITHDLGISLRFKCYVPEYTLEDTSLQKLIRTKIIEIVEDMLTEGRLSVTEVANLVRNSFSDIIRHVDIYGINNNINLQMIETMDKTKRPIIKQELALDENKMLILNKSILVQFVS